MSSTSLQSNSDRSGPPDMLRIAREVAALRDEIRRLRTEVASPGPKLLEIDQVAERLALSERSVRSLVSTGELASVKVRRRRLVRRKDLERFVEEHLSRPETSVNDHRSGGRIQS